MTAPTLPSASAWPRLLACLGPGLLPHVRTTGAAAVHGTAVHEYLADALSLGVDAALVRAPEAMRAELARLDPLAILRDLQPPGAAALGRAHAEVALAWDVERDAARYLGHRIERRYADGQGGPPTATEVPMSLDLLLIEHPERPVVVDWKTGQSVGRAATNAQLLLGALGATRWLGARRARVALVYLRPDTAPRVDAADLEPSDLDAAAERFAERVDELHAARAAFFGGARTLPTLDEGDHCSWCPSAVYCPAKVDALRSLADPAAPLALALRDPAQDLAVLTPLAAGRAKQAIDRLKPLLRRAEDALRAYGAEREIVTPDGRRWRTGERSRDEVDGVRAHAYLEQELGREVADAACSLSASKASIRSAVRDWAAAHGEPVGAAIARALDAIERGGAVTASSYATLVEVTE